MRAAAEAFDKRGYLGVNLKDIVEQLGLTKGALYYFFPAKEDLAVEIVNRYVAAWEPMATADSTMPGDNLDALVEMSYRVARTVQVDPIARAGSRLLIESNLIQTDLPPPFDGGITRVARLVAAAQSLGQVRAEIEPTVIAEMIVAFFYGSLSLSRHAGEPTDLVTQLDRFWAVLVPSLRTRPAPPILQVVPALPATSPA